MPLPYQLLPKLNKLREYCDNAFQFIEALQIKLFILKDPNE